MLSPAQSSFRPGHSTQDLLIKVSEDWKLALDYYKIVGITFIDLRKAFDLTDHSLLLAKLHAYGFDDVSTRYFSSYFSTHQQRVVLDIVCSEWATVHCSIPQGSILGPLLFIIYMNDLPNVLISFCLLMI